MKAKWKKSGFEGWAPLAVIPEKGPTFTHVHELEPQSFGNNMWQGGATRIVCRRNDSNKSWRHFVDIFRNMDAGMTEVMEGYRSEFCFKW